MNLKMNIIKVKPKDIRLDKKSIKLRQNIILALEKYRRGHIGPAFSCLEIMRIIFDNYLIKKERLNDFILSKGHGCLALYSILYENKKIDKKTLLSFTGIDSILGGHPESFVPTVKFSTGSLGHGLSVGAGMSTADNILKNNKKVFVLLGDGEINEGSVWEAAMFIAKHKLNNLITLIDYNKMQSYGKVKDITGLEPLKKKWESFQFNVLSINGHDLKEIKHSLNKAIKLKSKPTVIICNTIKGKGVKKIENVPEWHYKSNLTDEEINHLKNNLI